MFYVKAIYMLECCDINFDIVLVCFFVAMINTTTKTNTSIKGFISSYGFQSIIKGGQGKNSKNIDLGRNHGECFTGVFPYYSSKHKSYMIS